MGNWVPYETAGLLVDTNLDREKSAGRGVEERLSGISVHVRTTLSRPTTMVGTDRVRPRSPKPALALPPMIVRHFANDINDVTFKRGVLAAGQRMGRL